MSGRGLVVWGGGGARAAETRAAEGSLVVAWPGADPRPLGAAGVPFRTLEAVLGPEGMAAAEAAARSWARVWPRLALAEGRSFRELIQWRGESLLWAAEGFLRTGTCGPRCARTAELCLRLVESLRPVEIDVIGLPQADALLLARAATSCGVLFHGGAAAARPLIPPEKAPARGALRRVFDGLRLGRRPQHARLAPESVLLALAAREDHPALGRLLEAVPRTLALQPLILEPQALVRYETRRVRRAVADAERLLRERLRSLRGTPAVAASYVQRGVGFADLAAFDLEAVLLGRLPLAVRRLESAIELFEAVRPALVLLALPERDARRTLGMAAAAARVPWLSVRLGAREPDEPDRADGGPQPALALAAEDDPVRFAARLLETVRDRVGAR